MGSEVNELKVDAAKLVDRLVERIAELELQLAVKDVTITELVDGAR